MSNPIEVDGVPEFFVVFFTTRFASLADIASEAPELLAEHVASSTQLHQQGRLLMAGAFLDRPDEPLRTMGVLRTYDDAQHYAENDPFSELATSRTGRFGAGATSSADTPVIARVARITASLTALVARRRSGCWPVTRHDPVIVRIRTGAVAPAAR